MSPTQPTTSAIKRASTLLGERRNREAQAAIEAALTSLRNADPGLQRPECYLVRLELLAASTMVGLGWRSSAQQRLRSALGLLAGRTPLVEAT